MKDNTRISRLLAGGFLLAIVIVVGVFFVTHTPFSAGNRESKFELTANSSHSENANSDIVSAADGDSEMLQITDRQPAVAESARTFQPMDSSHVAALLAKTAKAAEAGQFELYKTTHHFDGTVANPQWFG